MFPNCIDRLGRQKRETKQQQTSKKKNQEKNEQIKSRNNSTYHELIPEEWIGRRS